MNTNNYQGELARLLKLSTLTPGNYRPSEAMRNTNHAAVFVGESPIILCGPSDDPESVIQADALAACVQFSKALHANGRAGEVHSGLVAGAHVNWQDNESAIISSVTNQVEMGGGDDGALIAIVLNDPGYALATFLCINTETARIFDANVPELDDGSRLSALARNNASKQVGSALASKISGTQMAELGRTAKSDETTLELGNEIEN